MRLQTELKHFRSHTTDCQHDPTRKLEKIFAISISDKPNRQKTWVRKLYEKTRGASVTNSAYTFESKYVHKHVQYTYINIRRKIGLCAHIRTCIELCCCACASARTYIYIYIYISYPQCTCKWSTQTCKSKQGAHCWRQALEITRGRTDTSSRNGGLSKWITCVSQDTTHRLEWENI